MNILSDTSDKLGNGEIIQPVLANSRKSTIKKVSKGWEDAPKKYVDLNEDAPILGSFSISNPSAISRPLQTPQPRIKRASSAHRQPELVIDDFHADDFDSDDEISVTISNLSTWAFSRGIPINSQILQDLNSVIFPFKGKAAFGEEWAGKGFVFREEEELRYGLNQLKGGPCGLLAAVQAFVVKHLHFDAQKHGISYLSLLLIL